MEPEDTNHYYICIPSDICTHVCLYLPVKSLLRFRSVSKKWNSMIDNFTSLHLSCYPNNNLESHLLVLDRKEENERSHETKARLFNCCTATEDYRQILEFDPPSELDSIGRYSSWLAVVGDVDGLLLVQRKQKKWIFGDVFLWNPSIRKSLNIPLPPSRSSLVKERIKLFFGFDHSTKDYKVVNIFHSSRTMINFEIFSLNSRSWRIRCRPNDSDILEDLGASSAEKKIYFRGYVHWIRYVDVDADEYTSILVSFNMTSETFIYTIKSNQLVDSKPVILDRSMVGLMISTIDETGFGIWALEKDRSWSKRYAFDFYLDMALASFPVCFQKNGIIWGLALNRGTIFSYDSGTKKKSVVSQLTDFWPFYIGNFVESLLLLS